MGKLLLKKNTKKTTEQFINESILIHGNKYDYSLVDYINNKSKIKIICPDHGIFEQIPKAHLVGQGCKKCSSATLTTEIFIIRANEIHGGKYDYSLVNYTTYEMKVKIICPEHGIFEQTPNNHLKNHGCKQCMIKRKKLSKENFIIRANKIHSNKYDYSHVNYVNNKYKVKISCPLHGVFYQTPSDHLTGYGCAVCSGNSKKSIEQFISEATIAHRNKYDYSLSEYNGTDVKIKIICPEHGIFMQTPYKHLNGQGCRKCSRSISKKETKWLDFLKISERQYKIPETNYVVDGYDKKTNTCYEFYGDFWHGNLNFFQQHEINDVLQKTYKELFEKTIDRENEIKKLGYKIVTIWENDFDKRLKISKIFNSSEIIDWSNPFNECLLVCPIDKKTSEKTNTIIYKNKR